MLGGDDAFLYPMLALGAAGGVVATANVAPSAFASMAAAARTDTERARSLHEALLPLTHALFAEPSPSVIKAVLAETGQIEQAFVRAPLRSPQRATIEAALAALKGLAA